MSTRLPSSRLAARMSAEYAATATSVPPQFQADAQIAGEMVQVIANQG